MATHYNTIMQPPLLNTIITRAIDAVRGGAHEDSAFADACVQLGRQYSGPAYDIAVVSLTERLEVERDARRAALRACAVKGCGAGRAAGSQGCGRHVGGLARRTCVDVEAVR